MYYDLVVSELFLSMPLPGGIRDYVCVMGPVEAFDVASKLIHVSFRFVVAISCAFAALLPFCAPNQIRYRCFFLAAHQTGQIPVRWCVIISARGVTSCDLIFDKNAGRSFFVHTYDVHMSMCI